MTITVGDALMDWFNYGGDLHQSFIEVMRAYGRTYPTPLGAYGNRFAMISIFWRGCTYANTVAEMLATIETMI